MVSPLLGGIGRSAVPENAKIAVVDVESMLLTTPAGKRAKDAFEKSHKAKQAALDKEQADLKNADADLVKQKAVLKPEVFEARRQELEKKFVDLQQTFVKLERELAQDQAKLTQDLFDQAKPKIALIAKAEGITVVIDKGQTMYADATIDLTQKVNAEMK